MYENKNEIPITRRQFYIRLFRHFLVILTMVICSLMVGIAGFAFIEKMPISEAFLHTSILLSGLGLVEKPVTTTGHWFVGIYGLYSGLMFIASLGILMSPVVHRIIHKLHWDDNSQAK